MPHIMRLSMQKTEEYRNDQGSRIFHENEAQALANAKGSDVFLLANEGTKLFTANPSAVPPVKAGNITVKAYPRVDGVMPPADALADWLYQQFGWDNTESHQFAALALSAPALYVAAKKLQDSDIDDAIEGLPYPYKVQYRVMLVELFAALALVDSKNGVNQ